MSDRCDLTALMGGRGVRRTPVRLAVLEVLAGTQRSLTAQEILREVRDRRGVNKVTVYRILEDFTARGILRRLRVEDRASRYEMACEHHPPHPHFQCHTCGEVQCLEPVSLDGVWNALRGPLGNRADRIEIRVEGVCQRCREVK
jgi:Fur family ferric uptake transcriptional regulator